MISDRTAISVSFVDAGLPFATQTKANIPTDDGRKQAAESSFTIA